MSMKFFNVAVQYTVQTSSIATIAANNADEARVKIMEYLGPQADNLIITSVVEVQNPNENVEVNGEAADNVTNLADHRVN